MVTSAACLVLLEPLAPAQAPPDGNQLVAAAVQSLCEMPSLEAKVRQRAVLLGQRLTGAGSYVQLRDGQHVLSRLDYKLQLADHSLSLLQVNDGTTLWVRQDRGPLQSLSYVNLRTLREAQQKVSKGSYYRGNRGADQLAIGGLGQLLHSLAAEFEFGAPRSSQLKGVPTWEVEGTWNAARRSKLVPERPAGGDVSPSDQLAEHLPDAVQLTLSRDQIFPLFPYRIEYLRTHRRPAVVGVASGSEFAVEPLVTMELFELRRRPDLTPSHFVFPLSNAEARDLTSEYLRKLGLAAPEN
jgi:hypothetical protein